MNKKQSYKILQNLDSILVLLRSREFRELSDEDYKNILEKCDENLRIVSESSAAKMFDYENAFLSCMLFQIAKELHDIKEDEE